jgi:hypothetical protein
VSPIHLAGAGCLLLAACAAGDARFTAAEPAGFWFGLWHGFIAPIAFVIGLFSDGVEIYERTNTGGWYDFGFLFGIMCLHGCGHRSHRKWREKKGEGWQIPIGRGKARVRVDIDWTGEEPEAMTKPASAGDEPKSPIGSLGESSADRS